MATTQNTPTDEATSVEQAVRDDRAPAEPAPAEPAQAEPSAPEQTASGHTAPGNTAPEQTAPRRVSRRGARKPADAAAAAERPAGEEAPEGTAGPVKAVRKRATRRRAVPAPEQSGSPAESAPVAVPEQTGEGGAVESEAAAEPTATDDTPAGGAAAEDTALGGAAADETATEDTALEHPAGQAAAWTEPEDADAPPVVPSFSVLFQAPDPEAATTRRPRRRHLEPEPDIQSEPAEQVPEPEAPEPAAEAREEDEGPRRSRRRRGGKGRRGRGGSEAEDGEVSEQGAPAPAGEPVEPAAEGDQADGDQHNGEQDAGGHGTEGEDGTSRRRRRRRRSGSGGDGSGDEAGVTTRVRSRAHSDEPTGVKGSTRLEAKKQRRREGREAGRRRTVITEAEFLARRESVERVMVVRNRNGRTQMGVLEDGVLVEHYIDQAGNVSMAGNIYLGRIQNVLPSMEAAFVDIGKGRNAVLYAGEVNWDAAGLDANQPKRIENALESGQAVVVQVTKDPIGHKGARLTSQISLPGRYLVYVPNASMTGISRKLPDNERARLKKILRQVVPEHAGVIVRTAAEGASGEELQADVERLSTTWEDIQARAQAAAAPKSGKSKGRKKNGGSGSSPTGSAPLLLHGEPDLTVRVIRDIFNEDFSQLVVSGEQAWQEIHPYITAVAPDLADRVTRWTGTDDLFTHYRVDEQLAKAMDRKVWLPSGGSLVIDRTEAMTVIDVNTGKFIGSGGNLEETVTKNNIEAAEEIVRQLRLRDIGGIIVVDFIDMVLESNRDLVVRRLLECLGRDRTKHQVAEVTSLGLVQMTRKRVGSGLVEVFSETCDQCNGRGFIIHTDPVGKGAHQHDGASSGRRARRGSDAAASGNGNGNGSGNEARGSRSAEPEAKPSGPTAAQIAAMAHAAAVKTARPADEGDQAEPVPTDSLTGVDAQVEPDRTGPRSAGPRQAAAEQQERTAAGSDGSAPEPVATDPASAPDGSPAQTTQPPEPVEPVAEAATGVAPPAEPGLTEPEPEPPTAEPNAQPEPVRRPRRHRGRVVAPAGPPGAAHVVHVAAPDRDEGSSGATAGPAPEGSTAGL